MESIIKGQDDQFRITQVLLFLQNLCEGHNIQMKVGDICFVITKGLFESSMG